jgi:hypothetical protein
MFAELVQRVDGRKWDQVVDRAVGGQRLIELLPPGARGVGPEELMSLTFITPAPRVELSAFPKLSMDQLRANCLDGNSSTVFISESSQQIAYSISVTGDALIGDVSHVYRVIKGLSRLAVMTYEHRGLVGSEDRALWAQKLLKIPLQALTDAPSLPESQPCTDRSLPPLVDLRTCLVALAAREPNP